MLTDYQELNKREGRKGEVVFRKKKQHVQGKEGRQNPACLKNCKHLMSVEHRVGVSEKPKTGCEMGRARSCYPCYTGGEPIIDIKLAVK